MWDMDYEITRQAISNCLGISLDRVVRDSVALKNQGQWTILFDGYHFDGAVYTDSGKWALDVRGASGPARRADTRELFDALVNARDLYVDPIWHEQNEIIAALKRAYGLTFWCFGYPKRHESRVTPITWQGYAFRLCGTVACVRGIQITSPLSLLLAHHLGKLPSPGPF